MKTIVKHILMLTLAVLPVVSTQARTAGVRKDGETVVVTDDLKAKVLFEVNKTALDAGLSTNKAEMDKIADYVSNLKNVPSLQVCITAFASPEGQFGLNKNLATGRAASVRKYIQEQLKANGITVDESRIRVNVVAENWTGLKDYVTVEAIPFNAEISKILDDASLNEDQKKARIVALDNGKVWGNLVKNVFPTLRTAIVSMYANHEESVDDKGANGNNVSYGAYGTKANGYDAAKNAGYAVESGMNVDDASKAAVAGNAALISGFDAFVKDANQGQWSVYANAGVSGFHGFRNVADSETSHTVSPDINAGVAYRFNPWFRLGLNLRYTQLGTMNTKSAQSVEKNPNFVLEGQKTTLTTTTANIVDQNNGHFAMAGATAEFNLLGFGEKGASRKAGLWLGTGLGYAHGWNHHSLTQAISEEASVIDPVGKQAVYNHNYIKTPSEDQQSNSVYVPVNLLFSYDLTKHVAFEVQGNYYCFPHDRIATAKGLWAADAGFRYNF